MNRDQRKAMGTEPIDGEAHWEQEHLELLEADRREALALHKKKWGVP